MKLEIASCREVEPSQRADAIRNFIREGRSDSEVARYLQSNFEEDFFEVYTRYCWLIYMNNNQCFNPSFMSGGRSQMLGTRS